MQVWTCTPPKQDRSLVWFVVVATSLSVACGKSGSESVAEGGSGVKGSTQGGKGAKPASDGLRFRDLPGVDLTGSFTVALGSGATAQHGQITLTKSGDERYGGSADIGGKKLSVLAHRDGNSVVGLFKPKNDGTWVGHYKVFCDRALEGTTVEPITKSVGLEFAMASSDSIEGTSTIKAAKNFDGRYKGKFTLKPSGDATRGTYTRTDGWEGKAIGIRIGDVLAVSYELGSGNFYVFNLMMDDSTATSIVGKAASRSLLKDAFVTDMSWSRPAAAGAVAVKPTGGSTDSFSSGGACITAPEGGHDLERELTPAGGGGGGGGGGGEDCSKVISYHAAKCGHPTCQVNLDSDINNCGRCGNSCEFGFTCDRGSCVPN